MSEDVPCRMSQTRSQTRVPEENDSSHAFFSVGSAKNTTALTPDRRTHISHASCSSTPRNVDEASPFGNFVSAIETETTTHALLKISCIVIFGRGLSQKTSKNLMPIDYSQKAISPSIGRRFVGD